MALVSKLSVARLMVEPSASLGDFLLQCPTVGGRKKVDCCLPAGLGFFQVDTVQVQRD